MPEPRRPIPQPKPMEPQPPPPELLQLLLPPSPSTLRVTQVLATGQPELAVVYKRTYVIEPGRPCRPADEQPPLAEEAAPHEELTPGVAPSCRALTETIGFKTGTDVVVQGSARPPRPTTTTTVAV